LARAEDAAAMEKRLSTDKNDQIRALSEKLQVLEKKSVFCFKIFSKVYFFSLSRNPMF
jgi:hypothetical protein